MRFFLKKITAVILVFSSLLFAYYRYPPTYARRLYLWSGSDSAPGKPTGVLRDTLHYKLDGYLSLFCVDTVNSIRIWMSSIDSTPCFRMVTEDGDTTRINSGGIYTTGVLNAKTLQGKDTITIHTYPGTDSALVQKGDTVIATIGKGPTCVASGTGAFAWGTSDTASGAQAVVAGGSANNASGDSAGVGAGRRNRATARGSFVGGGIANSTSGIHAVVAGGTSNTASGLNSIVAGGISNTASAARSVVGGGGYNSAIGTLATIGGGNTNIAKGDYASILGGEANACSSYCGVALGDSNRNRALDTASVLIGGGWGLGRLTSSAPRQIRLGWRRANLDLFEDDSAVVNPYVRFISHGPAQFDSAVTICSTGVRSGNELFVDGDIEASGQVKMSAFALGAAVWDSITYAADTSAMYIWTRGKKGTVTLAAP